jgi:hypothetical protein
MGMGVARRGFRPPRVRARRRPVRGRPASRDRHRGRRRRGGSRTRVRRGDVRRRGPDPRPDGDDRHAGAQGVTHAPRTAARQARHARDRRRSDRGCRSLRRVRARGAIYPPRDQACGLGRHVRRSAGAPSAAECTRPHSSTGTRGAARTCPSARAYAHPDCDRTAGDSAHDTRSVARAVRADGCRGGSPCPLRYVGTRLSERTVHLDSGAVPKGPGNCEPSRHPRTGRRWIPFAERREAAIGGCPPFGSRTPGGEARLRGWCHPDAGQERSNPSG